MSLHHRYSTRQQKKHKVYANVSSLALSRAEHERISNF